LALTPELTELAQAGKLRYIVQHRVLWPDRSMKPAEAAECAADQGKFWAYNELLFQNQASGLTESKLKELAGQAGLDTQVFGECLASEKHKSVVEAETKDAAAKGINSTPSFVVNGQRLELKQSYREVIDAIQQALKQK
jgi:protein-disulfide isomerase